MSRDLDCYDRPFDFHNDHSRMQYFADPEGKLPDVMLHDTTDEDFTITIMSGLAGAGKSTWIGREQRPGGTIDGQTVVSMDRLRFDAKARQNDETIQGQVRQAALLQARRLLAAKTSFVWDGTNLDWQRRQSLVSLSLNYGARVRFSYVEAPAGRLLAQNHERKAQVPVDAIERMLRKWEPPTLTEGHEVLINAEYAKAEDLPVSFQGRMVD